MQREVHEESEKRQSEEITKRVQAGDEVPIEKRKKDNYIWVAEEKLTFKGKDDMPSYTYKPDPTSGKCNKVNFTHSAAYLVANATSKDFQHAHRCGWTGTK